MPLYFSYSVNDIQETIFQVSYKNIVFYHIEVSNVVSNSYHLREVLLHCFISEKTAAENHCILGKVYGEHALSETTCRDWFWCFKRGDFDLSNKDRGKPTKKFEGAELQALLDEDSSQTLKKLPEALGIDQGTISRRLHAIGKIQKEGKWVPYELIERDIERGKTTCEILFDRFTRKSFLHRIVTGDE